MIIGKQKKLMPIKTLKLGEVVQNWSTKERPCLILEAFFALSFRCVPVGFELKGLAFPFLNFAWNSSEFQTKLNKTNLGH